MPIIELIRLHIKFTFSENLWNKFIKIILADMTLNKKIENTSLINKKITFIIHG